MKTDSSNPAASPSSSEPRQSGHQQQQHQQISQHMLSSQLIPNTGGHINNNGNNSSNPYQGSEFDNQSPSYLDSNWTLSLLMDPNHNMLYNMEMPGYDGIVKSDFNNNTGNSSNTIGSTKVINSRNGTGNPPTSTNSIMQSIQFQNNIHPEPLSPSPSAKLEIGAISSSNLNMLDHDTVNHTTDNEIISPQSSMNLPKPSKQRRPCDHCRRKKTKCVIVPNTNNCVQCEAKSLTCTFNTQALKRRAVDEYDSPSTKRRDDETIVPPNVKIRDVAPVQDYSSMSNSLLRKTLSLQFPRSSFYVGPTSYLYDVNILNLIPETPIKSRESTASPTKSSTSKVEQINLNETVSLRKVSDKVLFILKDDQSPQSYQTMTNDVDTIEKFIAPHGQMLIDLFFRIIHPSYPVLHKKVFLEKYSRTHREFSAPLLAAVYVLAIQWWDYDPQLNRYPKPNVELILKIGLNNYLLEILKRPKLSGVQAGLLLLQCKHVISLTTKKTAENGPTPKKSTTPSDTDYSDWVLCSQVVAVAEELGLGLDCNNWKLPKWERGLRKRLAWAVYVEDKWLSLKNSRPSHINSNNWMIVQLLEEDFPEKHGDGDLKEGSSDIDNGKKMFKSFIDLSMILSDILDQFYSMRAMHDITDVQQVLKIAKPLQLRLRNWYHALPVELQMVSVQPRKLCSNGNIQLAYFATELSLHRKISTIIYQQIVAGNSPPKELVTVCRTAAKTRLLGSIEFVRDLKPEHIHSFWHSSAASNFTLIGTFAALLFISAPDEEEANFYRDQIFNYRWILKISSKGFDQVAEASKQLDMVLSQIPGLLHDQPVAPVAPTDYKPESEVESSHNSPGLTMHVNRHQPNNSHTPLAQQYDQRRPSLTSSHSFGQTPHQHT